MGSILGCAGLLACSAAGDTGSNRSGGRGSGVSPTGADDGTAGGPASEPGGFGNSTVAPPAPVDPLVTDPMGNMGDGASPEDCEVGVFCAPTSPDSDDCGSLTLEADVEVTVTPGNVLVIFDQSGSMEDQWPGTGGPKMTAAQNALIGALTPLQDLLTVGAVFFPTYACVPALPPPPGGAVAPITDAQQISFRPGAQFLTAFQQHWTQFSIGLGIGTPMQEAFDRAEAALMSANLTGQTAVVAFTEGAPNCFPDPNLTGVPTDFEVNRATNWLGAGTKTYVVGLPGAGAAGQLLDSVASAGGTTSYLTPDDPAQLEAQLRSIVEETVKVGFETCVINLTPPADAPGELQVVVEEEGLRSQVPRDLGNGAGWSITDDGATVQFTGAFCDDATGGRFSQITFEYGCVDLPPLPPPPPPD